MATRSSTLAWKIPWMEEPGGLQSIGSLRVGHNGVTSLSLFTFMLWRRKWVPPPVFLPGESYGERPGKLLSMGSQRVRHDWSDLAAAAAAGGRGKEREACSFYWHRLEFYPLKTNWFHVFLFPRFILYFLHPGPLPPGTTTACLCLATQHHPTRRPDSNVSNGLNNPFNVNFPQLRIQSQMRDSI